MYGRENVLSFGMCSIHSQLFLHISALESSIFEMQVGSRDFAYNDLGQLLKTLRVTCGRQLGPGEHVAYIVDRKIDLAPDKIPDVSWAGARQVKICPDLHKA